MRSTVKQRKGVIVILQCFRLLVHFQIHKQGKRRLLKKRTIPEATVVIPNTSKCTAGEENEGIHIYIAAVVHSSSCTIAAVGRGGRWGGGSGRKIEKREVR